MLYGRSEDCAVISEMLDQARRARSSVLVLHGEAGVGKSALLDFASRSAGDLSVLRCSGVESEIELPFAALHQLLYPVLAQLGALPERQATALRGAFGLGPQLSATDRIDPFAVSVAVLTLLGEIAGDTGLVCLLDDAQWLDQASAEAVAFAARRLEAEGVMLLLTARDDEPRRFAPQGLPRRHLVGLEQSSAELLLDDQVVGMAAAVRRQLVAETRGNPLALTELTRLLTVAQLSGREALPQPLPVGRGIEAIYASRLDRLPEPTQTLLLLAAAEDLGELHTILAAGAMFGAGSEALESAEQAELIAVSADRLSFRHPLVRSAIYQHAPAARRRAAHQAIADALTAAGEADRQAWHRAAATLGADETVAEELERSAGRSRSRGGFAASADALERAGALSSDGNERGRRLTLAAEDAWLAGQADRATGLLIRAQPLIVTATQRSRILHLRGEIEIRDGALDEAYRLLTASAALSADTDPETALDSLVLAGEIASTIGDARLSIEVGTRAEALGRITDGRSAGKISLLVGLARLFAGDVVTATRMLGEVAAANADLTDPERLLWAGRAVLPLGDLEAARQATRRALDLVRATGAGALLAPILNRAAYIDLFAGRLTEAEVAASEVLRLAYPTGLDALIAANTSAVIAAYRGDESTCRDLAGRSQGVAAQRQIRIVAAGADWAAGLLELGLGRPEHALARLSGLATEGTGHPGILRWATPDLVESAVHSGRPEACAMAVTRLESWVAGTGLPGPSAALARCHALLADAESAEAHLLRALAYDAVATRPLERARTELLLGENLRRRRQRTRSRGHLRAALQTFELAGATVWADRARAELRASGETARQRDPSTVQALTAQELQVAQFAAAGSSNTEIAAKLFLSRRTVEYHLAKVFTKLGINSRQQLPDLSPVAPEPVGQPLGG